MPVALLQIYMDCSVSPPHVYPFAFCCPACLGFYPLASSHTYIVYASGHIFAANAENEIEIQALLFDIGSQILWAAINGKDPRATALPIHWTVARNSKVYVMEALS